jgi:transposase InsO family protein
MPFSEHTPMQQRILLLQAYHSGAFSVAELCRHFGISRETFYVWKRRHDQGDPRWFEDHSSAPLTTPHAIDEALSARLVQLRRRYKHFGPKKLRMLLLKEQADAPATSTIGELLRREGLITATQRRARAQPQPPLITPVHHANDEWPIDFKGWARTLNGHRCDPLTLTDSATRYLLDVRIAQPTHGNVKTILTRAFQRYGMPRAMRCDNGAPFGSHGAGGLSQLAVWLIKLNIEPRFIPPASPQNNARHERMHRTLKAQTMTPLAATVSQQQRRFDRFRHHYNHERPHESLAQHTPASLYQPSPRAYSKHIQEPNYTQAHAIRRVRTDGTIKWKGQYLFISQPLSGEWIALTEQDSDAYLLQFYTYDLGLINQHQRFIRFAPPRAYWREQSE